MAPVRRYMQFFALLHLLLPFACFFSSCLNASTEPKHLVKRFSSKFPAFKLLTDYTKLRIVRKIRQGTDSSFTNSKLLTEAAHEAILYIHEAELVPDSSELLRQLLREVGDEIELLQRRENEHIKLFLYILTIKIMQAALVIMYYSVPIFLILSVIKAISE